MEVGSFSFHLVGSENEIINLTPIGLSQMDKYFNHIFQWIDRLSFDHHPSKQARS